MAVTPAGVRRTANTRMSSCRDNRQALERPRMTRIYADKRRVLYPRPSASSAVRCFLLVLLRSQSHQLRRSGDCEAFAVIARKQRVGPAAHAASDRFGFAIDRQHGSELQLRRLEI